MKKRLIYIIILGFSVIPAVFAQGPMGQMHVAQLDESARAAERRDRYYCSETESAANGKPVPSNSGQSTQSQAIVEVGVPR